MYNILIGGAAGEGIETMSTVFEKFLHQQGCHFFSLRDFMSRIRGGHNFSQIRFGNKPLAAHIDELDLLVVLDLESYRQHQARLKADGIIFHDKNLLLDDKRTVALPLKDTAEKAGGAKLIGSVIVGALLKTFAFHIQDVEKVFRSLLRAELVETNITAAKLGFELVQTKLRHPGGARDKQIAITGATAIALGALAANVTFYSGYPMSPSTTILDYFQAQAEYLGLTVEQAEDEIAAINMALGASYAGARAMTATSGGGFSLMVEGLGFAGIAEIPVVIANMQRPGPATGFPTRTEQSDLNFVINAAQGEFPRLVIALRGQEDTFYQTARAVELAYKYQIPVILLGDQYLADSVNTVRPFSLQKLFQAENIPQHNQKENYLRYKITASGISPNLVPNTTKHVVCIASDEHGEYGHITESAETRNQMTDKRLRKMTLLAQELLEPLFVGSQTFQTLLLGFGSTCGVISEAVATLNQQEQNKYAALIFGDIHPLPAQKLLECAKRAKHIINIEQNATGQLAALIRERTLVDCDASILKYDGRQISVDYIITALRRIKQERN